MKSSTNRYLYIFLFLGFCFCSHPPMPLPSEKNSNPIVSSRELRLTYHAVWLSLQPFQLKTSASLFGTGNLYELEVPFGSLPGPYRIASTDRENQSQFPYLQQTIGKEPKVFYFTWKEKRVSVLTLPTASGGVYLRWEGLHNGYLIIVETFQTNQESSRELAQKLQDFVAECLEIY